MSPSEPTSAAEAGNQAPESSRTVLSLIRALQTGEVSGATLSVADRRRVVEHLWGEGYSAAETAEIVKITERTILRDRAAIRQANAISPQEGFVPETVGALLRQADHTVSRLRRIAKEKATPAAAKVDAELGCWTVARDLVATLQTLGYLPTAPRQFQGELTHRVHEPPSYGEFEAELDRVNGILADGGDAQALGQVARIRDTVTRLSLSHQVKSLTSSVPPTSTGDPDHAQSTEQP